MNSRQLFTRRNVLKASAASMVAVAGGLTFGSDCEATIYRGDGPFYPHQEIPASFDLTTLPGKSGKATGQVLYVFGSVQDTDCRPIPGARVEIWQADSKGRYNHEGHRTASPLDPYFQYFGQVQTGGDGRYLFKTLVPARYTISGLNRAPHIHFKIKNADHRLLTTELYFAGDENHMAGDEVFQSIPLAKRPTLIREKGRPEDYAATGIDFETGSRCCQFDLVLVPKDRKPA